jgi:hypothetical protein
LDLGGTLKLSQLENVIGADAQAAGLGNKKKLTELELCWSWTHSEQEAQNNHNNEVLEGLKPHDGLKALRVNRFGSSTFPAWMSTLRGMVELQLFGCKKVKELPALWELPALQVLHLQGLERVHCLCSGGTTPVTFPELKFLTLFGMENLEAWWETHEELPQPIFPKVEELEIEECKSLTALPKATPVISGVDTMYRSAFPALRKMTLGKLTMFERWEEGEGISGEEVTFPRLEELSISECGRLSALPKGSLLVRQSCGEAETVCCRSAFPVLRILELSSLSALERWGVAERTLNEEVAFPRLEELFIVSCGSLSALPKGSVTTELSGKVDIKCRSAFPALRKMMLGNLTTFERWEAGEEISGEEVTFPQLEELSIWACDSLSALPKGSLLVKQSCDGAKSVCCRSAFPALRKLDLRDLWALERWGATEGTPGEEITFPLLQSLDIDSCPRLTDLPEAPKLSELCLFGKTGGEQQISLEAASRCIPSLSRLNLDVSTEETETTLLHLKKKWNGTLALPAMRLCSCDIFFLLPLKHTSFMDMFCTASRFGDSGLQCS